jgi:NAD(P)-dependent dehydrogenase (short-subunit alcohol dehydrogenase family)
MKQPVALVTGGSSGIGQATAIALNSYGYIVYAGARRLDRMDPLKAIGIHTVELDVSNDLSMQTVVQTIHQESGPISLLINNAGYGSYGALEDVPFEEARRQFEVNVFGLARLCQLVIPGMRRQKRGTIINISSIGGKFGQPFGAWYHASKHAIEGLADSLRQEVEPFGINVVTIEPGLIKTEWATIAADNLLKASGNGAYSRLAKQRVAGMKRYGNSRIASSPEVVAQGILKILNKPNPKYRYAVGGGARTILLVRKLTSDRLFYGLLRRLG